jgi:hypothetical protein
MSTMFSGSGGSSAGSVGQGAGGATAPTATEGGNKSATGTQPGGNSQATGTQSSGNSGETPFFKETIKVDGKDVEIAFKNKQELLAEIQKARASGKRFEESAKARKEAEALHTEAMKAKQEADELRAKYGDNTLQASIDAAIRSGDPERIKRAREVMENQLAGLIRRDMMDPKERALEQERTRREAAEKEVQDYRTKEEKAAHETQVNHFRQEFTTTIIGALETGQVPNTDWTSAIMANLMRHNMQKGFKLTPEALAEKTKNVIMGQVTGLLGKATGDQLISWFPDLIKKVRAADLARIKNRQPRQGTAQKPLEVAKPQGDQKPTKNGYMSPDEWREWTKRRALASQNGQPLPD